MNAIIDWADHCLASKPKTRPHRGRDGHVILWKHMPKDIRRAAERALSGDAEAMMDLSDWYFDASDEDALFLRYGTAALTEGTFWRQRAAALGNRRALSEQADSEPWLRTKPAKRKFAWRTTGVIEGIKVLQNIHGRPFLPDLANSSRAYILCDEEGRFLQMTEFAANHLPVRQIVYGPAPSLDSTGRSLFHYHDVRWPYCRGPAKRLTAAMVKRYGRYFKGRGQS